MEIPVKAASDLLSRVAWDLFGTITFQGKVPRPNKAFGQAWEHFRCASRLTGTRYDHLLIALRWERGEIGGRPHFHYLLGGTLTSNRMSLSKMLEREWVVRTGGFPEIRPFDISRNGCAYVSKCMDITGSGGDIFELRKFDRAEVVVVSSSVVRIIRASEQMRKAVTRYGVRENRSVESRSAQGVVENNNCRDEERDCQGLLASAPVASHMTSGVSRWRSTKDGFFSRCN